MSDFDDIFGDDVKIDATSEPTVTIETLEEEYGGECRRKLTKVAEHLGQGQANWEQIGSREQDEFLSWLDDGESVNAPAVVVPAAVNTFDNVSLDDDDEFDRMLESGNDQTHSSAFTPADPLDAQSRALEDDTDELDETRLHKSVKAPALATSAAPSVNLSPDKDVEYEQTTSCSTNSHVLAPEGVGNVISLDDDDDNLEQIVKRASIHLGANAFVPVAPIGNNLVDDDDDDDDLEQIIQKANRQANANNSRENSSSSLQIKSQVQLPHKAQIDVPAARQTYLESGKLPAGSRLAVWQRAVQPSAADSASMYAVQTTSRSLPSQALLRKEIETLCSRIFSSAAHARILHEVGDTMRGSHLLFIDSAETLLTYLCTQLDIDYMPGMVFTFAPLLLASGSEPLHPEIVEILAATCRRFLPHIVKQLPLRACATERRPLLKRMLLYHAPRLASHLSRHFPTWNHAPVEENDGSGESGAIADSWLASFFEGENIVSDSANFDFLLKVWDCSLVLEAFALNENAPLTVGCFITLYAIITAEKALMRMEGEQLRHCMVASLLETLLRGETTKDQVFVHGIRQLMSATPPCILTKLRSSGVPTPPTTACDAKPAEVQTAGSLANTNFGMNLLLSASTQGLKDVSNMMIDMPVKLMIDMPVKLLTMVPLNPMAALSSPSSQSLADSSDTQQLFYFHVQAMKVASTSVTLEPGEVIPSVFGGIQGHETGSLRYFIVDCRGADEMQRGQVPTAFQFDPDAVADSCVLDHVLATLGPLKNAGVHICVMGHGYAHIAQELRQFQQKQGALSASPFSLSEDFLETYANDQTRIQSTIDFLLKHEFPRVSVLDGGYSAAHGYLFRSRSLTVDDLADHDMPTCKLCHHDRSMEAVFSPVCGGALNTASGNDKKDFVHSDSLEFVANAKTGSPRTSEVSDNVAMDSSTLTDINLASNVKPPPPPAGSYYSNFADAFKSGGKTLLSPTMGGTKWLLKKSATTTAEFATAAVNMGNIGHRNRTGSISGAATASATPGSPTKEAKAAIPNLNKLRNSLVAIGTESLDMLKKVESAMEHAVEQAAVATTTTSAKVRVPFPSTIPSTSKETKASAFPTGATLATTPPAPRAALSSDPAHSKFFHSSTAETFTIDDDDDDDEDNEGHFVQDVDRNASRTSSTSSVAMDSPVAIGIIPTAIHEVTKGYNCELKKGMSVSRTQMLPCVSSPFFACYKKKASMGATALRSNTHPRRMVVMANYLVVLKPATRNEDDIFMVKSCHSLSHITRMTCLKKNALMVSIYYKWKAEDGQIVERRNSYEVQQRDDFIKAVKTTMDKM